MARHAVSVAASAVAFAALIVAAAAAAPPKAYDTEAMPASWSLASKALAPADIVTVRLALRQSNLDVLHDTLMQVSDPSHPRYARYWTKAQVDALVSPPAEAVDTVRHWLARGGATLVRDGGDVLEVAAPAAAMEALLGGVTLGIVVPAPSCSGNAVAQEPLVKVVAGGPIRLPAAVARVVQLVQEIGHFRSPLRHSACGTTLTGAAMLGDDDGPGNQDIVIPLTLQNNYQAGGYVISTNSSIGIVEYASDNAFSKTDMTMFCNGVNVQQPNAFHTTGPMHGVDGEATLDVQWGTAMGTNATNFYYTLSGWLLDFAQDLYKLASPPLVNSQSWATDERQSGSDYNGRLDAEYQKLGLRGVSMLAASGDSGAAGQATCNPPQYQFNPPYPGASPFALSVGATMLASSAAEAASGGDLPPVCTGHSFTCAASGAEVPANLPQSGGSGFSTGGGFAALAEQPAYQKAAVAEYLADSSIPKPPQSMWNGSHRAYPDVAANGNNVVVAQSGSWQLTGGTSASTPIWAGMLAIVNDHLFQAGKAPVGFVNPLLYSMAAAHPDAFTIIGTGTNKNGCKYGWASNPNGYAPVNGLGTPVLKEVLSYVDSIIDRFPPRPDFL